LIIISRRRCETLGIISKRSRETLVIISLRPASIQRTARVDRDPSARNQARLLRALGQREYIALSHSAGFYFRVAEF
jgi:hypothetical protein